MNNKTFTDALIFAAEKHRKQKRKEGAPYIYHPMKVAEIVKDAGYGIEYQIVAILHDVLEDTKTSEEEISDRFGNEILEAVKLLTRPKDADESEYVNAILKNHMAAVVKNADKISNLMDSVNSGDILWAKRYLKKAQRYYEGKFSKALDKTILDVGNALCLETPKIKTTLYSTEEMCLYVEKAMENYKHRKKLHDEQTEWPDFTKEDIEYWWEELLKFNFCIIDGKVWALGKSGWYPLNHDPIKESEYGEYLYQRTREEIDEFIEMKKKEKYFYDFVDFALL